MSQQPHRGPGVSGRAAALAVFVLGVAALVYWFESNDEGDLPAPPHEEPVPARGPVLAPPPLERAPVVEELDAGAIEDAGAVKPSKEPSGPGVEAYMQKWRDALAPLLKQRKPGPVTAITADRDTTEDAGCEPGVVSFPFAASRVVDHLVVVDTSGSMVPQGLQAASDWIGQLEFALANAGSDYHLLVLAEPSRLALGDAGVVQRTIGSHDALDIMLASASDERPRWLKRLRNNSELHIVLITDDKPLGDDASPYVQRLQDTLGDTHPFTFSIIGGFDIPAALSVLGATDPVSLRRCFPRGPGPRGVDPGVVYQQIAVATGGSRASLCSAPSRQALVNAVSGGTPSQSLCAWRLQTGARLREARARGPGHSDSLVREYSADQCPGTRRSYVLDGLDLAICPDTCLALKRDGFEEIEARIDCTP